MNNVAGVDVSKGKSVVSVLRPFGEVVAKPFSVGHTGSELKELADYLKSLDGETRVVMEHTGRYYEPVARFLHEEGIFVSAVNPKLIKDYGNNSLRKVKTDKADARKIARYGLDNWAELRQHTPMDSIRMQLKTLNRQQGLYSKAKTMMKNNLMDDDRINQEKHNCKSEKKGIKLFVLSLVILIFLPITAFAVLDWFASSDALAIGITGYIQTVIVNGVLGLLAVIIALVSMVKLAQPNKSFKQIIGRTVVIIVCVGAAFFLVRPLILDIPYLEHPEAAYLERLEFDYERGIGDYGSDSYYLRGVDMTGERHSFDISEKSFEDGRGLWSENDYNLFAKVTYLPHTSTLMTLEFMTELDTAGAELYPPSPELPNDWESFSIQINDTVYTLPVPLAAFLDDGWVISEEDAGLSLAGAVGPNASYEWEWISLTNDREQVVSICVFNTTESTISVAESTVGGIHVIYGNYDFSGTELRIPCGLMLGWSTREDVLKLYGQPNDSFEATYRTDTGAI